MRLNLFMPIVHGVDDLRNGLNNIFSELSGRLYGVAEVSPISGTSKDGTAAGDNLRTEIPHSLGFVPDYVHIEPKEQAAWWVPDAERSLWTKTRIYVRFDTDGVNFTGHVGRIER